MQAFPTASPRLVRAIVLLIALQAACAVFFALDVIDDLSVYGRLGLGTITLHLWVEAAASLALVVAIVLEVRLLLWLLRRQALIEHDLRLANSAVQEVVLEHFELWRLTGAEQDVAMFMVKGQSIAEIAALRGSSEATVKSHLNAIYRKSGTSGRPDLLALILDSLMGREPDPAAEGTIKT
ncbi:helix-turn-helix transcriptional regulator [Pararhodobacter zhoushanensis]|uniref:helix-turn-helix transcriptional regulator n=1 Tax=Pararhodobacter zhoushanensis TaxID=2479545 RepID=UPI000F8D1675|nr:helix-turn-helix transcriptional regulator [Pararhodobacter zhoushanensis]